MRGRLRMTQVGFWRRTGIYCTLILFNFYLLAHAPFLKFLQLICFPSLDQLFQLMQRLEKTTPHFIRCIKPNNLQLPGVYKQGMALQQLGCCGVLEVVRISRSGYPTRMSLQKFARRGTLPLKIHSVFQLQFFTSSISYQRCTKLAIQNSFSEVDRSI